MDSTLIFLIIGVIANILFLIYFFYNFNEEPKISIKDYQSIRDIHLIGDASNWVILYYYTSPIFNWVRDRKHLTEADKASCYSFKQKLQTSCEWVSKSGNLYKGIATSDYDGIRIMNKNTDETLVISWSNDDVIVGTWIDKESDVKCIQIIDN